MTPTEDKPFSLIDHYESLSERYYKKSLFYQAQLFHAWRVIREQNKGLNRQAREIKRLRAGYPSRLEHLENVRRAAERGLRASQPVGADWGDSRMVDIFQHILDELERYVGDKRTDKKINSGPEVD